MVLTAIAVQAVVEHRRRQRSETCAGGWRPSGLVFTDTMGGPMEPARPGAALKEMLGHKSIRVALDTYSHVIPGLQEHAVAVLD